MAEIHIYSLAVCPFAQRTRIALTLKGIAFELTEIAFAMTELSAAPFFQRWCLNDWYRAVPAPQGEGFARVRRWYDACLAHAAVCATGMADEDYIKLYED